MPTKVSSISFPVSNQTTGNSAFGVPYSGSGVGTVTAVRTRTGVSVPKWHDKIRNLQNATSAMTATYDTIRADKTDTTIQISYPGVGTAKYVCRGDAWLKPAIATAKLPRSPTLAATEADNQAAQAFLNKVRQAQVQFQGLVFAGELRETLRMIKSPAKALREGMEGYLGALRKRKRADPRHWPRAIGGTYLEHSFGWQPLLHDIEDAVTAYERLTRHTNVRRLSAGATRVYDQTSAIAAQAGVNKTAKFGHGPYDYYKSFDVLEEQHKVRYKGIYVTQVNATQWDNKKLFGITFEEFLPTVWELLPWSWLVDYVTNIGDLLNNFVTATHDVRWVNKTVIRTTRWWGSGIIDKSFIQSSVGSGNPVVAFGSPGAFEVSRKEVSRSSGVGVPRPGFYFQSPGAGQLGNIAALLATAFSLHPQRHGSMLRNSTVNRGL